MVLEELKRAPKQKDALLSIYSLNSSTKKPIKVSDLSKHHSISAASLKALIDKSIIEDYYLSESRIGFEGDAESPLKALSDDQKRALHEINESLKEKSVALLHGVTSSGKTEIYVKLIEEQLQLGKQVLYLLPEIALTTQLVQRLQNYFGKQVAVFHSRYSNNERVEVWNSILKNSEKAQVIIGARSVIVFAI